MTQNKRNWKRKENVRASVLLDDHFQIFRQVNSPKIHFFDRHK